MFPGAVAVAIGWFDIFKGGFVAGWNRFFARGLFHRVIHVLPRFRFDTAEVMLGLVPVAFEGGFDAVPGGIGSDIPPSGIIMGCVSAHIMLISVCFVPTQISSGGPNRPK